LSPARTLVLCILRVNNIYQVNVYNQLWPDFDLEPEKLSEHVDSSVSVRLSRISLLVQETIHM